MTQVDAAAVTALVRQVAAEVITPRFRALARHEVFTKGPGDLVTIADHESEALLIEGLGLLDPQAPVLGEEGASADPSLASRVQAAERYWVVDPVDGTSNFASGHPDWGVMVAYVVSDQVVGAWIWQPVHDRMYVAERGAGATRNDVPLARRGGGADDGRPLHGYARLRYFDRDTAAAVSDHAEAAGIPLDPGPAAACVTYGMLAEGEPDFALYGRAKPWDHLPGQLLLEETGGEVRRLDGTTYLPSSSRVGLLAVTDRLTSERLRGLLLG